MKKLIALLLIAALLMAAGCAATADVIALPPVVTPTPAPDEPAYIGTPSDPEAETEIVYETIAPIECAVVCKEYLPVRAEAAHGQEAEKDLLFPGDVVTVTDFDGIFAHISYGDSAEGYVQYGYLQPTASDTNLAGLTVVKPVTDYSYEQMVSDLESLSSLYAGSLTVVSAGQSGMGRDIPVAVVGSGGRAIFVQASIQGREHMTTLLAMAQLEYILKYDVDLSGVQVHIMPMSNPDGVMISQVGTGGDETLGKRLKGIYDAEIASETTALAPADYLKQWQADSYGVDVNRNFPAGWDAMESGTAPASEGYKGDAAGSAAETKALMDYTNKNSFAATLSYHAYGCNLYWKHSTEAESYDAVNAASSGLADALAVKTAFWKKDGNSLGGYKDWAIEQGVPSVTVEMGGRRCPMPADEFAMLWQRCRTVVEVTCSWAAAN